MAIIHAARKLFADPQDHAARKVRKAPVVTAAPKVRKALVENADLLAPVATAVHKAHAVHAELEAPVVNAALQENAALLVCLDPLALLDLKVQKDDLAKPAPLVIKAQLAYLDQLVLPDNKESKVQLDLKVTLVRKVKKEILVYKAQEERLDLPDLAENPGVQDLKGYRDLKEFLVNKDPEVYQVAKGNAAAQDLADLADLADPVFALL